MDISYKQSVEILKEPILHEFIGNEKAFELYVKECLPEIFKNMKLPEIRSIKQQHQIKVDGIQIRLDLIVQHIDESMSVIEVKCPNKKHPATSTVEQMKAIGQVLLYKSIIKSVYGHEPRLFLVDNKIHYRTMLAFSEMKLPITLIELQRNRVFIPYNVNN
ncbi:MAG: hypothetical protein ABF649_00705 [Bacillus sp. (in: firmicutes)]